MSTRQNYKLIFKLILIGCFSLMAISTSQFLDAADKRDENIIVKGCEYKPIDLNKYGYEKFKSATVVRSENGTLKTSLNAAYASHTLAGCPTHLRNYNGALVGPTLRLKPGEKLLVSLTNNLPDTDEKKPEDINIPHNFNITNFHSHGLHVSPSGNSDNVLISVIPGVNYEVEINVPADHPTGTFWYHAHVHGSTALQVSSGMAGTLIIENSQSPTSLDSVPEIKAAKEKIFLMQQIGYDEQGVIENYDCFGPGSKQSVGCNWSKSNRHTSINGQFVPTIELNEGEVERWRFIHGGIRETINLAISGNNDIAWPLYEIAVDGLSLGYINRWDDIELQPGYRSDILVKAPQLEYGLKEQVYWLYDKPTTAAKSLRATEEVRQVLAKIIVKPGKKDMKLPCNIFNQRDKCQKLALTRPHKDIKGPELNGADQSVTFNIEKMTCPVDPLMPCQPCDAGKDCKTRFMINNRPFNPVNIRKLELGTASEWALTSQLANHPFHIHVNPFQYTRKNPDGKDEIIWRDTLLILQGAPAVNIRSRYQRYIGKFVIHCHILDHEDQGMMQIVDISLPGGDAHHH